VPTNNIEFYSPNIVIGEGGFGKVYKAKLYNLKDNAKY